MLAKFYAALSSYFKGAAFRAAFLSLTKKVIMRAVKFSSFKNWLIGLIVEDLYDDIAKPIINRRINRLGFVLDVFEGKEILKKLQDATGANNEQDYNDSLDDLFNARGK